MTKDKITYRLKEGGSIGSLMAKQWKKEQVWPFFDLCIADSQTDAGRYQLYNNGSIVLFSSAY